MSSWKHLEEQRLVEVARSIRLELIPSPNWREKGMPYPTYRVIDLRGQRIVYGASDDRSIHKVRRFLEDRAKVELPRLRAEAREKTRAKRERLRAAKRKAEFARRRPGELVPAPKQLGEQERWGANTPADE
jgi:hypothetical protein